MSRTQKNTLVLIVNLKVYIVGLVILLTSMVNTAAYAAVSPVPLLVEQCLRYSFPTSAVSADSNTNAIALERGFIGFFNINDRINYYRLFPISSADRELLLQCQLYLADELHLYLNSDEFQAMQFSFASNNEPSIKALLNRINQLAKYKKSAAFKAQLHTAQATFKQQVSSKALSLNIVDKQCQLQSSDNTNEPATSFIGSLANYLIKQPSEHCRQRVWQAYQSRAAIKNKMALDTILSLRQQQAEQAGYSHYSDFVIDSQLLNSIAAVEHFLQSSTQNIGIAPWNLGYQLSKAPSSSVTALNAHQWLINAAKVLETLELKFEWINNKSIRLWHRQRLLGDIYLSQSQKIALKPIKQTVVGQQFGQMELSLPSKLTQYRQQKQATSALAEAITRLSKGQHFYLLNTLAQTADTRDIDRLWLEYWLVEKLLDEPKTGSREAILTVYSQQLNVFRAKVALDLYQQQPDYIKYKQMFYNSFGQYWQNSEDAPFTFSAIVYQGPLYYQKVWQQSLARYIYQSTKDCKNQQDIYNTLVVNEPADTLQVVLKRLLGEPVDAIPLITRIQHALDAQDFRSGRCTFLRQ
ncbi:M3 family metallopeptidase [Shewanella youngdeokensis]|uniref:M3 family metallopeptidase n=1 Tax=Shewanella youngdeokensis TaxID=2999068 RepID=A0ABZ0K275_9GAMM|nr:M3 family metallopeptidase [Shewanella sp. DAU334]